MRLLINLFWNFLLIGLFGVGAVSAGLPLIYDRVVVANKWLQPGQFADVLALCRMLPGPTDLNLAAFTGFHVGGNISAWMGLAGVLTAVAAMAAVSFVAMFPALRLFADKGGNTLAEGVLEALRPVTAGMMMAFFLLMLNAQNFGHPTLFPWDFAASVFLFIATLAGVHYFRFNPVFMLLLCGLAGIFLY